MNLQFINLVMCSCLALFGWEEHVVEGRKVWLHASGFVLYQQ